MALIKTYENYRKKGLDELEALGATFLKISVLDMNKELADLRFHVGKDIIDNIKNDKTFEEDNNERITTAI